MATKGLPSIPSIPGNISPDLYAVLSAIKTQIDFSSNSSGTTNAVDQAQLEAAVASAVTGITKGDTGAPGAPGSSGANGKSYVLDITGGRTSIIYDAAGANPLPTMAAFGCELYEDGVLVTPSSYSWFISDPANSLLSGTGSAATFTPTVAGTFNQAKGNNAVILVVSYAGLSIRATEPVAITKVGAAGADGATGPQGTAGTPGAPGTPGASSYFHVAYADSADGSINFNQLSGSYIGTYVDAIVTDSNDPADYNWVLIKGAQGPTGDQGIPGTNGADGTTSYLHIKYSNDGGTTFTGSGGEDVGEYLGQYVDNTLLDSTDPADYTWALIKGIDGTNGVNGTRTAILDLYQWAASEPTTFPVGTSTYTWATGQFTNPATLNGWSATPPAPVAGQILYIARQVYADSGTSATSSVTWSVSTAKPISAAGVDGVDGDDGLAGANGQRVGFLEVYKWAASAPAVLPSGTSTYTWATGSFTPPTAANGWSLTPGPAVAGQTLWGISVNVSDNLTTATSTATWNSSTVYAVGAAGTNGANGKTYLLFITGGKTNAVYDADGLNPLPAPTAFSAELYEDGTLVTPGTFAWSVPATNSLLSGSSATATFTPALNASYDSAKGDNRVLLTCTYGGQTIKAVQPIVISKQASAGTVDTTPPPAIDDLFVTGGVLYNFVTWGTIPGNTDHVEVYRAATDDRTIATVIGSSKVKMYLDYIPEGVGTEYFYWIRAISKADVTGEWNLVSGVVSSAGTSAAPVGINDSQVGTISASKIIAATLSAFSADLGTVTAGLLKSADDNFQIDLSDKSITIAGPAGLLADDYTLLKNGQVEFWKWTGATHQEGRSLSTIEAGTAANGSTVTLSKWYASIPNIIVTPNDTPIYNAANASQSQKLQVRAENVAITGGGSVSFTAVSRLVLSGANPSIPVTDTYSGSSNTDTTTTYTTAANTTKIDANLSFSSKRGTGTSPNFYYRKVDARIAYRIAGSGGAYTLTAWTTTNINNNFNTYTASLTTGNIASGSYEFYVEFLAADRGGTFTSGTTTYTTSYVTRSLASNSADYVASGGTYNVSGSITLPSYTPPAGGYVESTTYTIAYSYYLYNNFGGGASTIKNNTGATIHSLSTAGVLGDYTLASQNGSFNFSAAGYNPALSNVMSAAKIQFNSVAAFNIKATTTNAYLTVKTPAANVATPENVFTLVSYSLTLSTATVIDSSGTLNWVAIG